VPAYCHRSAVRPIALRIGLLPGPAITAHVVQRSTSSPVQGGHRLVRTGLQFRDGAAALDVLPSLPLGCGDDTEQQKTTGTEGGSFLAPTVGVSGQSESIADKTAETNEENRNAESERNDVRNVSAGQEKSPPSRSTPRKSRRAHFHGPPPRRQRRAFHRWGRSTESRDRPPWRRHHSARGTTGAPGEATKIMLQ